MSTREMARSTHRQRCCTLAFNVHLSSLHMPRRYCTGDKPGMITCPTISCTTFCTRKMRSTGDLRVAFVCGKRRWLHELMDASPHLTKLGQPLFGAHMRSLSSTFRAWDAWTSFGTIRLMAWVLQRQEASAGKAHTWLLISDAVTPFSRPCTLASCPLLGGVVRVVNGLCRGTSSFPSSRSTSLTLPASWSTGRNLASWRGGWPNLA
mmetsp:Transcript_137188/g.238564  ORF Transcript_137188/g.238564 Transcript_137188/m.238564 type:complete len:207 (-) Transcript_137188:91-711(-)